MFANCSSLVVAVDNSVEELIASWTSWYLSLNEPKIVNVDFFSKADFPKHVENDGPEITD